MQVSEYQPSASLSKTCPVCMGENKRVIYNGRLINRHIFHMCSSCGFVCAVSVDGESMNYDEYGDYLVNGERDIKKRINYIRKAHAKTFSFLKKENIKTILDFGCGAGYFCKAGEEEGFEMFGVEISDKLINYSKTEVGFKTIYKAVEEFNKDSFGVIFMLDVIEHLKPEEANKIIKDLISHLNRNGYLIGNTPNFRSANINLCKEKDPAVSPPSHLCYFTKKTIDKYFISLGLKKEKLYTSGMSTNSFFRKEKYRKSIMEMGIKNVSIKEMPFVFFIKVLFKLLGYIVQPLGMGYQIHFIYRKL